MTNILNNLGVDPENQNMPQTMGDRFRQARELSPLSRAAFCFKHGLNCYTVQSWELGRSFSRTPNAIKFCGALAAEGIVCTEDWLIDGVGPEPYLASVSEARTYAPLVTPRQLMKKSPNLHENLAQKEIALFYEHSSQMGMDGVVIQVPDKAMSPDYEAGEMIGALRIPLDQVSRFHQVVCLIEATSHRFLVRHLLKDADTYILLATNKDYPLIHLDQITSIAEIVWRRRMPIFCTGKGFLSQG